MVTHIDGEEVHAMNMKDHTMMILPVDPDIEVASGQEILGWKHLEDTKLNVKTVLFSKPQNRMILLLDR